MFTPSLLSTLLLAFAVVSATPLTKNKPLVTLPISRRVNAASLRGLHHHDLKRAQALGARGKAALTAELVDIPATDGIFRYTIDIEVGSPPTTCECSYGVIHPLPIPFPVIRHSHRRHPEVARFLPLTISRSPDIRISSSIVPTRGSGLSRRTVMSIHPRVSTLKTMLYVLLYYPV